MTHAELKAKIEVLERWTSDFTITCGELMAEYRAQLSTLGPEPPNKTDIAIDRAWVAGCRYGWNCAQYDDSVPDCMQTKKYTEAKIAAQHRYEAAVNGRLRDIREAKGGK